MTGYDVLLLRQRLGLTQQQLADAIGVHVTTVSRWESRGKSQTLHKSKVMAIEALIKKGY